MINNKKVLAIIPARGGSKRLPQKNIRVIAGKPLIAWTIEEAKKSKYIDRLILSSEDAGIIQTAKDHGCEVPFTRPPELSRDDTPGIEVVIHAINELGGYDYAVLLQPTSPLRIVEDIDNCIEKCITENAAACVTVEEARKSPYWMYRLDERGRFKHLMNDSERYTGEIYVLNGAVYVAKCDFLINEKTFICPDTVGYIMPRRRSVDIDTELDFMLGEMLLKEGRFSDFK